MAPTGKPTIQTAFRGTQDASGQLDPGFRGSEVLPLPRRTTTMSLGSPVDDEAIVDDYVVPDADHEKLEDERFGLLWNRIMDQGSYSTGHSYTSVQVLMLSHDEEQDDLDLGPEMADLKRVLEERFRYGVTVEKIKKHRQKIKRSQAQVNAIVAQWAYQYDGFRTLLIVYYAGHGHYSEDKNELELYGRKEPMYEVGGGEFNKVVWDNTERNLHYLNADVLQIFDCCFAGAITAGCADEDQTIEFLAACGANEKTPAPGPNSFTRAMIWALGRFADEGGNFTVSHLLRDIKSAPGFSQRRKQTPTLIRRARKPIQQRIVLHPLEDKAGANSSSSRDASDSRAKSEKADLQYALNLKFTWFARPTQEHIEKLATELNTIVRVHGLPMSNISWQGLSTSRATARIFVNYLQEKMIFGKRGRDPGEEGENAKFRRTMTAEVSSLNKTLHHIDDDIHRRAEGKPAIEE